MRDTISASAGLGADTQNPSFLGHAHTAPAAIGGSLQDTAPTPDLIVVFGTCGPDTAGLFMLPVPAPTAPDLIGAPVTVPAGVSSVVIDFATLVPGQSDSGQ